MGNRPLARALAIIPAALLILVAARQVHLVHAHELTPWLGGGFGMFATVDRIDHRVTRAILETPDGDLSAILERHDGRARLMARARLVEVADRRPGFGALRAIRRLEMKARAMPTEERLADLASALGRLRWTRTPAGTARARLAPAEALEDDPPLEVFGVRVEVWRLEVDGSNALLGTRPLAAYHWRSRG